jgi:hypothetical protein
VSEAPATLDDFCGDSLAIVNRLVIHRRVIQFSAQCRFVLLYIIDRADHRERMSRTRVAAIICDVAAVMPEASAPAFVRGLFKKER